MPVGPNGGLLVYTIYGRPADHPGSPYIVRPFEVLDGAPRPLPYVWSASTLDLARAIIPPSADTCIPRFPDDEPQIVESWM